MLTDTIKIMFGSITKILGLGKECRTAGVSCAQPDASLIQMEIEADENKPPLGLTERLSQRLKEGNRSESENSRLQRKLEDQKKTSQAAYQDLKDTYERKLNDVHQELEKLGDENATLCTELENLKDNNKRFRFLCFVKSFVFDFILDIFGYYTDGFLHILLCITCHDIVGGSRGAGYNPTMALSWS